MIDIPLRIYGHDTDFTPIVADRFYNQDAQQPNGTPRGDSVPIVATAEELELHMPVAVAEAVDGHVGLA